MLSCSVLFILFMVQSANIAIYGSIKLCSVFMKVLSFDIWDYLHFFYTSDKYLVILHGSVKSELCTKAKLKVDHTNAYQGDKIQFSMFMYVLL